MKTVAQKHYDGRYEAFPPEVLMEEEKAKEFVNKLNALCEEYDFPKIEIEVSEIRVSNGRPIDLKLNYYPIECEL